MALSYYLSNRLTVNIIALEIIMIIPTILFKVLLSNLLAILEAILAQMKVNRTQRINEAISSTGSIAKCEREPVKAVKAMMNTEVPTAICIS